MSFEEQEYGNDLSYGNAFNLSYGDFEIPVIGQYRLIFQDIDSIKVWNALSTKNIHFSLFVSKTGQTLEEFVSQNTQLDLSSLIESIGDTSISTTDIGYYYIMFRIIEEFGTQTMEENSTNSILRIIESAKMRKPQDFNEYVNTLISEAQENNIDIDSNITLFINGIDNWLQSIKYRSENIKKLKDMTEMFNTRINKWSKYETGIKLLNDGDIVSAQIVQPVKIIRDEYAYPIDTLNTLYELFDSVECSQNLNYCRLNLLRDSTTEEIESKHKVYAVDGLPKVKKICSVPIIDGEGNLKYSNESNILARNIVEMFDTKPEYEKSMEVQIKLNNLSRFVIIQDRTSDIYKTILNKSLKLGSTAIQNNSFMMLDVNKELLEYNMEDDKFNFKISTELIDVLNTNIPSLYIDNSYIDFSNIKFMFNLSVPIYNASAFYCWIMSKPYLRSFIVPRPSIVTQGLRDRLVLLFLPSLGININDYNNVMKYGIVCHIDASVQQKGSKYSGTYVGGSSGDVNLRISLSKVSTNSQINMIQMIIISMLNMFLIDYTNSYEDLNIEDSMETGNMFQIEQFVGTDIFRLSIEKLEKSHILDTEEVKKKMTKAIEPTLYPLDSETLCKNGIGHIVRTKREADNLRSVMRKFIDENGKEREEPTIVIPMPPLNPKFWVISSKINSDFRYISVSENHGINSDIWKFLPCNFQKSQLLPTSNGSDYDTLEGYQRIKSDIEMAGDAVINSDYNRYALYMESLLTGSEFEDRMPKTTFGAPRLVDHIMRTGQIGFISDSLNTLLNNIIPLSDEETFIRLKLPTSINSAIHCCAYAVGDEEYINSVNQEEYVDNIRNKMLEELSISLIAQETYDIDDEERRYLLKMGRHSGMVNRILDVGVEEEQIYFNTSLFLPLLEEYFKINILVFEYDKRTRQSGFEMPRYKNVYVDRRTNEQKTWPIVILLRYQNQPRLQVPQYKIIGVNKSTRNDVYTKLTFEYDENLFGIKKLFINQFNIVDVKDVVLTREVYEDFDIYEKIKDRFEIIGQHIDDYGKCRGFNIKFNSSNITIMTRPCKPVNLPSTNQIYNATYEDAVEIFGSGYRKNERGIYFATYLNGDIPYAFVPLESTEDIDLPVTSNIWMREMIEDNQVDVNREVRAKACFYMQMIYWVYAIGIKYSQNINILTILRAPSTMKGILNEYSVEYVDIDDGYVELYLYGDEVLDIENFSVENGDSHKDLFDISKLSIDLPVMNNTREALKYLYENTSGIVVMKGEEYYLSCYSLKQYQKLMYVWKKYNYNFRSSTVQIPRIVNNLYSPSIPVAKKLSVKRHTLLFTESNDLSLWLEKIIESDEEGKVDWEKGDDKMENELIKLNDKIIPQRLAMTQAPYIFINNIHERIGIGKGDEVYIIQRVEKDNKIRAFNCSLIWQTKGYNPGFNTSIKIEGKEISLSAIDNERYIIYRLVNGIPYPYEKHVVGEEGIVMQLLEYAEGKYCAMLPLQVPRWK